MLLSSESPCSWACDRGEKGTTIVQNLPATYLPLDTASHPTRPEYSATPHASYPNTLSSIRVFGRVIPDGSKYRNAFIFRVTLFLGLWSCRKRYYDRPKLTGNLFATRHGVTSHKTRIFSNIALITWNLAYFFTAGICVRPNYDLFFPMTRSLTEAVDRAIRAVGGLLEAREISVVSLLTALWRGTFTLKAAVSSQSVKQPRRFVLRTMIVLHSGWILHYSIKTFNNSVKRKGIRRAGGL